MQWKVRKEPRTEVPSNLRLGRLEGRTNSRVYLGLGLGAKAITNVQRERETQTTHTCNSGARADKQSLDKVPTGHV